MTRVVLATRNEHKVAELRAILADSVARLDLDIVAVSAYPDVPDVPETEVTFAGNALLKARAVASATGLPALADDSGLTVDVLGGAPGVFSARWAGRQQPPGRDTQDRANLALLLDQLADVPAAHRRASFVCAAAVALPEGRYAVAHGEVPGRLAAAPVGEGGFGYDPIFVPDEQDGERTFAQFSAQDKHAISHRGRAFRALAADLALLLPSAH